MEVRKIRKWFYMVPAMVLLVSTFGINGCGGIGSTGSGPFVDMLKLIPDTPETRHRVDIVNHAKIREIYNIPLPSPDADDEAIEEYIAMLLGDVSEAEDDPSAGCRFYRTSFISGMGSYAFSSPIRRQNIGFGPQDVDIDIIAGWEPIPFEAIKGDFELAAIEDALNQYDESVLPDIDSYRDIPLYIWAYEINQSWIGDRFSPPVFDDKGRGKTLAVQEDYIFRIDTPELIKAMINASQGRIASLADNPDFNLMAMALAEMGTYSVFLSDEVMYLDDETLIDRFFIIDIIGSSDLDFSELFKEELQQIKNAIVAAAAGELLSVFRTYASGIGQDDEGPFMTMVYVYDSPQQASSDVDVFRQQIEEGFSVWTWEPWRDMVDSVEVWADGRSLLARLRGDIASMWIDIVSTCETLVWCRE